MLCIVIQSGAFYMANRRFWVRTVPKTRQEGDIKLVATDVHLIFQNGNGWLVGFNNKMKLDPNKNPYSTSSVIWVPKDEYTLDNNIMDPILIWTEIE